MAKKNTATRREEIVAAAALLFRQKGYAATTMRELGEQVGMEAASMYNHIKGKDELLREICLSVAEAYMRQMAAIKTDIPSPIEQLKALIRFHVRIVFDDANRISVANNEWKHLPEPALSAFKAARDAYESGMYDMIQEGVRRGEVNAVDPSVALYTALSAVRWVEFWFRPDRSIAPETLEDNIIRLLMNGLQKN